MKLDKKVAAGEVKFVLAEKIGRVVWGRKIPSALVEDLLAVPS
jgi:3-dehydroquinate synthetase